MGDYLGCNDSSGYGRFVTSQCGINQPVIFSANGQILLAKFGRSSKTLDRILVLTKSHLQIIAEVLVDKKLKLQKEFSLLVNGISYAGLSTLQDNWVAISLSSPTPTTPDVFIKTDSKTELVTQLRKINGGISVKVDLTVQYQKKPGKYHTVKFQHGAAPKYSDTYKSGTWVVEPGLPENQETF